MASVNEAFRRRREGASLEHEAHRKFVLAMFQAATDGKEEDVVRAAQTMGEKLRLPAARVLTDYKDAHARTVMHFAANAGQVAVVRRLASEAAELVNAQDREGHTPLMMAVLGGHLEAAQALVEVGAQANARNKEKDGCLHFACRHDHMEILAWLLTLQVPIRKVGRFGTPLHECAAAGQISGIDMLLQAVRQRAEAKAAEGGAAAAGGGSADGASASTPAEADVDGTTPDAEVARFLAWRNNDGFTAAMLAAAAGKPRTVLHLVELGSPVGHRASAQGLTLLHFAADRGMEEVVAAVLQRPGAAAAVLIPNEHELLPIHMAARQSHAGIVEQLWAGSQAALQQEGAEPLTREAFLQQQVDIHKQEEAEEEARRAAAARAAGEPAAVMAADDEEMEQLPEVPADDASEEDKQASEDEKQSGNTFFRAKQWQPAAEAYTRAIEKNPRNKAAYLNRSTVLLKLGRAEEALADAKMARALDPEYAKSYYREGQACMAMRRYHRAAQILFAGYQLDNDSDQLATLFRQAVELGKQAQQLPGRPPAGGAQPVP